MEKVVVLVLLAVLGGCAQTQWVNRVSSNANFHADKLTCEIQARNQFPDIVYRPAPPQPATYKTTCSGFGNTTNCTSTPEVQTDNSDLQTLAAKPGTQLSRSIFEGRCLAAKGWSR
jgi:outer membrane murein-binding lipoprotein Lpp